jgi:hypothetical protein
MTYCGVTLKKGSDTADYIGSIFILMGITSLLEFYRSLSEKTGKEKHIQTFQWILGRSLYV